MSAEGGFGDRDPLLENTDDRNAGNDDDGDRTGRFDPTVTSSPGPSIPLQTRTTTMNRPPERGSRTEETSFIEGYVSGRRMNTEGDTYDAAQNALKEIYPDVNFTEIEASFSKTGRLQVRQHESITGKTEKPYYLKTKDKNTGEERLNPSLPKKIKELLGVTREEQIAQKEKEEQEVIERIQQNEEIANDENEDLSVRERARSKTREDRVMLNQIRRGKDELEEGLSLREKVKRIFKKYGFTVTAVLLAVGTTIGVILSSLSNGLKDVAKVSGFCDSSVYDTVPTVVEDVCGADSFLRLCESGLTDDLLVY
ncbi:hypothetical protein ACROYT_G040493 [Oculina patagonica]